MVQDTAEKRATVREFHEMIENHFFIPVDVCRRWFCVQSQ